MTLSPIHRRRGVAVLATAALSVPLALTATGAAGADAQPSTGAVLPSAPVALPTDDPLPVPGPDEEESLIGLALDDAAQAQLLVDEGVDLAEFVSPLGEDQTLVYAVLAPSELEWIEDQGIQTLEDAADDLAAEQGQSVASADEVPEAVAEVDTLSEMRAHWFRTADGNLYLDAEVKTDVEGGAATVTIDWGTGSSTMRAFVDAGEYLYHRTSGGPLPIDAVPEEVTFTSSAGAVLTTPVTEWLGTPESDPAGYETDFVDSYLNPTQVTERIVDIADDYPEISEIVDLPYKTNGYRAKAQAAIGGPGSASGLYVTSTDYGHEGGNDLTLQTVAEGTNAPLSVAVDGTAVTVNLATDAAGAPTSTAGDVVTALNGDDAVSELLTATASDGEGSGVVPATEVLPLSDGLSAPLDEVSRDPFQVKALRIGGERDGSKMGVFLYCQEHAREWVTPITCVETAERLVNNYATDAATKELVDNLDIFIMPTVNPDGGHYSFFDSALHRKNLSNYCSPEKSHPSYRAQWGVDLNRNFTVGSAHDGYDGASTTECFSGVYAGPEELSEAEAKNEVWITEQFPNIKFSMNTHAQGGYFMWAPGAYITEGRQVLPRPDFGTEEYFWQESRDILDDIQDWRGTAIWPSRTGAVADVIYSAAGNSADEHYYNKDIYAWNFEVGAPEYVNLFGDYFYWRGVGFQPDFESEGHAEAMEFSNGQISMLESALELQQDDEAPVSELVVTDRQEDSTSFQLLATSEAANIYYTLDGSKPTLDSPMVESAGLREGAEVFTVTDKTKVQWFAVDMAGNREKLQKDKVRVDHPGKKGRG